MQGLTREDLFSLEEYATERGAFRKKVIAHKKRRQVPIGAHATLYFEDRLSIQYQIQEILRVERIFEPAAIAEELEAYNPLIPDGSNLKATLMIEYEEAEERRLALQKLIGIEDKVWVEVEGRRTYAIADEDMDRENDVKTSAVHFLRFELDAQTCDSMKSGAAINIGIDHHNYNYRSAPVAEQTRASLAGDLS